MDDLGRRARSLRETAARQDGAISTLQLLGVGVSKGQIARNDALEQVHRGVYAYGPVRGPWFEEWAAYLAAGPRSALSRTTALAIYDLRLRPSIVHLTRPAAGKHKGVLIHRGDPGDVWTVHGLPVTSPTRTLQDLAPSTPKFELQRLVEEMQVRKLATDVDLTGRPGAAKLRAAQAHEPRLTRSEAERKLLDLVRAARLPHPETNVRVGRYEVDMLWRDQRLVVEIDGFEHHGTRPAFERDRIRDAELQSRGYRVLRITWRRLVHEPHAVVALLAAALSAARSA